MEMEKGIMSTMMAMMMAVMMLAVVQQVLPAQATPIVYTCPICSETFDSEAELEAHFTNEHPSQPIDIIWQ